MEVIHHRVKIIKRSQGRSAVGAAAYRTGDRLRNDRDGTIHDYTRRRGIVFTATLLPSHAPAEFHNREVLWNSVEKVEKSGVAQLSREVEFALPNNFDRPTQIKLVTEHVQKQFISKGMCADFAIHDMGSGNPHVHVMLTMRPLDINGQWGLKCKREYILNKKGQRIPLADGDFKSKRINTTDWDDRNNAGRWHKAWADECNREFERQNIERRVTNLSYEDQGLTQEPTQHIGVHAHQLEKKGVRTRRGDMNREIMQRNEERSRLEKALAETELQIQADKAELAQIEAREQVNKLNQSATITVEQLTKKRHILYSAPDAGAGSKKFEPNYETDRKKAELSKQVPTIKKEDIEPTKKIDPYHAKQPTPIRPTSQTAEPKVPDAPKPRTSDLGEIWQQYIDVSVEIKRQMILASQIEYDIRLLDSEREGIIEIEGSIRSFEERQAGHRQERDSLSPLFARAQRSQIEEKIKKLENSKMQALGHLNRTFSIENFSQIGTQKDELAMCKQAMVQKLSDLPDVNELVKQRQELEASCIKEYVKATPEQRHSCQLRSAEQEQKRNVIDRMAAREAENKLKQLVEPKQDKKREREIDREFDRRR